jgi:hypothetical protein
LLQPKQKQWVHWSLLWVSNDFSQRKTSRCKGLFLFFFQLWYAVRVKKQ